MEVTLVDSMGDDLRVVNAARVSFHKESSWLSGDPFPSGSKEVVEYNYDLKLLSESDQKLISYLAKHNHWTPFSHVQITMREKVPIFVARQRFKHMVGFTYNEVSRRYVSDDPEFYVPDQWRKKAENKKQGSSEETLLGDDAEWFDDKYTKLLAHVETLYKEMIEEGIAPEQARMILPQSMYTEYYVTGSLAAWARAYKLRIDPHAQLEIQDLAKEWNKIISNIKGLEHSWKALTQ